MHTAGAAAAAAACLHEDTLQCVLRMHTAGSMHIQIGASEALGIYKSAQCNHCTGQVPCTHSLVVMHTTVSV